MNLIRIDSKTFHKNPKRYELMSGKTEGAPTCPYGNQYQWVGYDHVNHNFVRFSKSIFKELIIKKNNEINREH